MNTLRVVVCGCGGLVRDAIEFLLDGLEYYVLVTRGCCEPCVTAHAAILADATVFISTNELGQLSSILELHELALVFCETTLENKVEKRRVIVLSLLRIRDAGETSLQFERVSHGLMWRNYVGWRGDCGLHSLMDYQMQHLRELEMDSCLVKNEDSVLGGIGEQHIISETWVVGESRVATPAQLADVWFPRTHAADIAAYLDRLLMLALFPTETSLNFVSPNRCFPAALKEIAFGSSTCCNFIGVKSANRVYIDVSDLETLSVRHKFDHIAYGHELKHIRSIKSWVLDGLMHAPFCIQAQHIPQSLHNPVSFSAVKFSKLEIVSVIASIFTRVRCSWLVHMLVPHPAGEGLVRAESRGLEQPRQSDGTARFEFGTNLADQLPSGYILANKHEVIDVYEIRLPGYQEALVKYALLSTVYLREDPGILAEVVWSWPSVQQYTKSTHDSVQCLCTAQPKHPLVIAGSREHVHIFVSATSPQAVGICEMARADCMQANISWKSSGQLSSVQPSQMSWYRDCVSDSPVGPHSMESTNLRADVASRLLYAIANHTRSDSTLREHFSPNHRGTFCNAASRLQTTSSHDLLRYSFPFARTSVHTYGGTRISHGDQPSRVCRRVKLTCGVQARSEYPCSSEPCEVLELSARALKMRKFLADTVLPCVAVALLDVSQFLYGSKKICGTIDSISGQANHNEKTNRAYAFLRFCGSRARILQPNHNCLLRGLA